MQNQIGAGIPYTDVTGLPADSILGSISGGAASALTPTQVTTFCNVFTLSLNGCVAAPISVSGRYLGDDGGWHAVATQTLTQGTNVTLTGTCTGAALNCQISAASTTQLVFSSRAAASALNLTGVSSIQTQGYAAAGDGGGATFKNVGTSPFLDSFIPAGTGGGTISSGGASYTTGTYYGVALTGGHGTGATATIVISSGIVQSVTITGTGGNGYQVGDVLSAAASSIGGTGSGFAWTVSSVTTPTGSFTDSAGNHFQIVIDAGNFPNARQFGAVLNWTAAGGDGAATNDKSAIQSELNFASYGAGSSDAGGSSGKFALVPAGTALICGGLVIPTTVRLKGIGESSTTLKECDAEASTQPFITVGDPSSHRTAFFAGIDDLTLFGANAGITGTVPMVYSNNVQGDIIRNVAIYPIYRSCVFTEIGWGGPSFIHIYNMYCVPNSSVTPFGVSLNSASNQVIDGGTWFSSGGTPWSGSAILVTTNGPGIVNRFIDVHCENMTSCVQYNVPAGGNGTMTYIQGMSGNATVSYVIDRLTGSASGQLQVQNSSGNGAGCLVFNAGACAQTTPLMGPTAY
ncbi:MAG: hypothetical protein KGL35_21935 [Bradyrhizobium sp.]|nr:hypothetical protein [Bradyrhizobium sp.]